jgi:PIN domain nuclease of toxin-antitoxin system
LKLLLDTHIAVWAIASLERLSTHALELIKNENNEIYVSAVSILEIAIKANSPNAKDPFPFSAHTAIKFFETAQFKMLNINAVHSAYVETLPLIHRDPFDRLLVAQALSEPMRLLTADAVVAEYSDTVIMAG